MFPLNTKAHCGESERWTRETLQRLAGEGVAVPTFGANTIEPELHPLQAQYRGMLEQGGLNAVRLQPTQPCLAINVSPSLLERALKIFQSLFSAFEQHGYQVDVMPPGSDQSSYASTLSRIVRCLLSKSRPPAAGFSGFR